MQEFLTFRRMITPLIIQIVFWIGFAGLMVIGLVTMATARGAAEIVAGLLMVLIGPIFWRVYCELIIIFFRIEENTRH